MAPPPDSKLFPEGLKTAWIKPGRALWSYLDGGNNTVEGMKEFARLAAELGFEYSVLEGFWSKWPESQLRELVDYSRQFPPARRWHPDLEAQQLAARTQTGPGIL